MNQFHSFPFNKNELSLIVYNAVMQNEHINMYFKDLDSKFIALSKKQAYHFGLKNPEEAIGKTDFDFFTKIHARQAFNDEQRIIATGEPMLHAIEVETMEDTGNNYVITSKYPLYDADNNIIGTWGHSITLESLSHSEEGLSIKSFVEKQMNTYDSLAQTDNMTEVKNVKALIDALNLSYQSAMNHMAMPDIDIALIMIDIEGFSKLNKDYGSHCGDSALIYLAKLLESVIQSKEEIFMYGTNAYAILKEVKNLDEAVDLAKAIVQETSDEPFQYEEWDMLLHLNVGICTFREVLPLGTIYDIMNLVDGRLEEAKKSDTSSIIYERK